MVCNIETSISALKQKLNNEFQSVTSLGSGNKKNSTQKNVHDDEHIEIICLSSDEDVHINRVPQKSASKCLEKKNDKIQESSSAIAASEERNVQRIIPNIVNNKENGGFNNKEAPQYCEVFQTIIHNDSTKIVSNNENDKNDSIANEEKTKPESELSENSDNLRIVPIPKSFKRKRRKISSSSNESEKVIVPKDKSDKNKRRRIIRLPVSTSSDEENNNRRLNISTSKSDRLERKRKRLKKSSSEAEFYSANSSVSEQSFHISDEYLAKNLEKFKSIVPILSENHKTTCATIILKALIGDIGERNVKELEYFLEKCSDKKMLHIYCDGPSTSRDAIYKNILLFIKETLESSKILRNRIIEKSPSEQKISSSSDDSENSENFNSDEEKFESTQSDEEEMISDKENRWNSKNSQNSRKRKTKKRSRKPNELEKLRKDIGNSFIKDQILALKPREHKKINYGLIDNHSESSDETEDSTDEINDQPSKKYNFRRIPSDTSSNAIHENEDVSYSSEQIETNKDIENNVSTPDGLLSKAFVSGENDDNRSTPDINIEDDPRISSFEKANQNVSDEDIDTDCSSGPSVVQSNDAEKGLESSSENDDQQFFFINKQNILGCRVNVKRMNLIGYTFPVKVYQENSNWKIKISEKTNDKETKKKDEENIPTYPSLTSKPMESISNGTEQNIQQIIETTEKTANNESSKQISQVNSPLKIETTEKTTNNEKESEESFSSTEKNPAMKSETRTNDEIFNCSKIIIIDDDEDDIKTSKKSIENELIKNRSDDISCIEQKINLATREEIVDPDRLIIAENQNINDEIKSQRKETTKTKDININTNRNLIQKVTQQGKDEIIITSNTAVPHFNETSSSKTSLPAKSMPNKNKTSPRKTVIGDTAKPLSMVENMEQKVLNLSFTSCRAGFYFRCHVGSCKYSNLHEDSFKYHLLSRHPVDKWAGYCNICSKSFSINTLPLTDEFEHMVQYHVKQVYEISLKNDNEMINRNKENNNLNKEVNQNSDCIILSSSLEVDLSPEPSTIKETSTTESNVSETILKLTITELSSTSKNEKDKSIDKEYVAPQTKETNIMEHIEDHPSNDKINEEFTTPGDNINFDENCTEIGAFENENFEVSEDNLNFSTTNSKQVLRFKLLPGDKLSGKNVIDKSSNDDCEADQIEMTLVDRDRVELLKKLSASAVKSRTMATNTQSLNIDVPIVETNSSTNATFLHSGNIPKHIVRVPYSLSVPSSPINDSISPPLKTYRKRSSIDIKRLHATDKTHTSNTTNFPITAMATLVSCLGNKNNKVETVQSSINYTITTPSISNIQNTAPILNPKQKNPNRPTARVAPSPKNFSIDLDSEIPKNVVEVRRDVKLASNIQPTNSVSNVSDTEFNLGASTSGNNSYSEYRIRKVVKTKLLRPWLSVEDIKSVDHIKSMLTFENLKKLFKCMFAICDFCTHDESEFRKHLGYHQLKASGPLDFRCCYCSSSFNDKYSLVAHIQNFYRSSKYLCYHCFYRTPCEYNIAEHLKTHTTLTSKRIIIINRTVDSALEDQQYKMIRLGKLPTIKCPMCSFQFYTFEQYNQHQSMCHVKFLFQCKKCMRTDNSDNVQNHHETCYGIYNYYCCYCNFGTQALDAMSNHIVNMHIEKFPFYIERSDISHLSLPMAKKAACIKKFSSSMIFQHTINAENR